MLSQYVIKSKANRENKNRINTDFSAFMRLDCLCDLYKRSALTIDLH